MEGIQTETKTSPEFLSAFDLCVRCGNEAALGDKAPKWPGYCASCHGIGAVRLREGLLEKLPERLNADGIPPNCQQWKLETPAFLAKAIERYYESPRGLFLWGRVGVGKTMAMALFLNDWYKKFIADEKNAYLHSIPDVWRWIDYPAFIMEIQDAFKNGDGETTAYQKLKKLADIPGLVIDDLGVEKPTPYVVQATYYLLDRREKYLRQTFITSNLPPSGLDEQYGARITDRIVGCCDVLEMTGKNRRLKP